MKYNLRSMRKTGKDAFFFLLMILSCVLLSGCSVSQDGGEERVYVYNWGDYVDPDVLDMFEEETGIEVVLEEFDTNESMYPRIASGAMHYDVLCPSDYMVQKLIENDLLQPLDWDLLPNVTKYTGEYYLRQAESFDPGNRYTSPYCWGTIGIMYNTTLVDEDIDSWSVLWDERYRDEILMQDSVRDAFSVALKLLGYSLNTTDEMELMEARDLLAQQKPLVQAYVVDEARDKLVSGEAAIGVVFSGEALMMQLMNEDLDFVVPGEGTNLWIDGWVIPADAENVENAHAFIDYMSRPEIALLNFEYLTYSTPNIAVQDMEEDPDYKDSPIAFPDPETFSGQETYTYLGEEMDRKYNDLWIQVKSY